MGELGAPLGGHAAIVTGGARGIGRATAESFAASGARVVIVDLDSEELELTARELGDRVVPLALDLTEPAAAERTIDFALERLGAIDVLVNGAGYALDRPVEDTSDDWFQRMLDVHLVAPFRLCRALVPHLRERAAAGAAGHRKVVNIASMDGIMGAAGEIGYVAGKAGLVGLTKGLAKEWAGLRVNVNAVAPGFTETRMTGVRDDTAVEISGEHVPLGVPSELREEILRTNPLGRMGEVEEVAHAIVFLSSPWSDYVHGHVLTVTGGQILGMNA